MVPLQMPSPSDMEITQNRLRAHAKRLYVGLNDVSEIRGRLKGNYLFLEAIKEESPGIGALLFKRKIVRGVGKLARLEYLGPNKWKFLIYDGTARKYVTSHDLREGTVEECLDAAAKVYLR